MTKNQNTKRALLASVLSMMLCVAMLVGSTFAWFTDSVTSGVNKIVAGNLDVEMEYATFNPDGTFNKWVSVEGETLFDQDTLWEPGHTEIVYLKVRNAGTLALKYKLSVDVTKETTGINVNGDTFKLSDYLVFGQTNCDGEKNSYATREDAWAAVGSTKGLSDYTKNSELAAETAEYVALVVYMPTDVGNVANYKTGTDAPTIELGIKLVATQNTVENDSFGNDYDRVAALIQEGYAAVGTADDLKAALNDGKNVVLTESITAKNLTAAKPGTVIDGNGNTITGVAEWGKDGNEGQGLWLAKGVEYKNINFALDSGWGVVVSDAKFTNCTFDKASPYFSPREGKEIVIDGCTFVNTTLQICYNEGAGKPETDNTIITNNKFVVNNTDIEVHAIVLGGGSPEFWANGAETVIITDNTFTPNNMDTTYIAYYIYGDYGETLTSVPVYNNNTYNGDANYALNSTAIENQKPLARESGIIYDEKAESIYISSAKGLASLSDFYKTLKGLNGDRHWQVYLTSDMDMSAYTWIPFNYNNNVPIDFNGQGHTISNLNCGMDTAGRSGFIGYFGNGKIQDLTFENVTAAGTQAGIIAGNAEGWSLANVTIKGQNSISYKRDNSLEYQEEWNAIGTIFGYNHRTSSFGSNFIIAEGATITLNYNSITTMANYLDVYSYGVDGNSLSAIVTNNGTITKSGRNS